jgi:hypothetical protein
MGTIITSADAIPSAPYYVLSDDSLRQPEIGMCAG